MSIVNEDGIVTPDEENAVELDVILAAMAASISKGIGTRLAAQEKFVAASVHLPYPANYPITNGQRIPYQVTPVSFVEGMTLSNGLITIEMDGLYQLSSRVTFEHAAGKLVSLEIRETPDRTLARGHGFATPFGETNVGYITVNETRRLYKGDQVFCTLIKYDNGLLEARAIGDIDSNNFSVTLVKPFIEV